EEEAVQAAAGFGGPVVLKAEAAGLVHKTEVGAVKLGLHGEAEVRAAYQELAGTFGARLTGALVEPMLSGGVEVLVGVMQEPVFGRLVVFGLGGVATEVLGDHAARLTPLTDADADDLIHGVHAAPLLLGHRGTAPVDTAALADVLLRVSRLADDLPEVAELDLNPVIATAGGAPAADARIRGTPAPPPGPPLGKPPRRWGMAGERTMTPAPGGSVAVESKHRGWIPASGTRQYRRLQRRYARTGTERAA